MFNDIEPELIEEMKETIIELSKQGKFEIPDLITTFEEVGIENARISYAYKCIDELIHSNLLQEQDIGYIAVESPEYNLE